MNSGDPIFPVASAGASLGPSADRVVMQSTAGISLRYHLAGMALQGLLSNSAYIASKDLAKVTVYPNVSKDALAFADQLIEALNKK